MGCNGSAEKMKCRKFLIVFRVVIIRSKAMAKRQACHLRYFEK